jgi:hypothetical protein
MDTWYSSSRGGILIAFTQSLNQEVGSNKLSLVSGSEFVRESCSQEMVALGEDNSARYLKGRRGQTKLRKSPAYNYISS